MNKSLEPELYFIIKANNNDGASTFIAICKVNLLIMKIIIML